LGLTGVLFFAAEVFQVQFQVEPIVIIVVIVLFYNLGFFFLHSWMRKKPGFEITQRGLRIEANSQIGLDLLCLVFLIHFSGGIENPFILFFVFHMILGS